METVEITVTELPEGWESGGYYVPPVEPGITAMVTNSTDEILRVESGTGHIYRVEPGDTVRHYTAPDQ